MTRCLEEGYSTDLERTLKVPDPLCLFYAIITLNAHLKGLDSTLPDDFGRSIMFGLSALTTFITVSVVGGIPFVIAAIILGILYYNCS